MKKLSNKGVVDTENKTIEGVGVDKVTDVDKINRMGKYKPNKLRFILMI